MSSYSSSAAAFSYSSVFSFVPTASSSYSSRQHVLTTTPVTW